MSDPLHDYEGLDFGAWENADLKGSWGGLVNLANAGDELSLRWIKRLERYGVTDSLLAEVNQAVSGIRLAAFLKLQTDAKKFSWRAIFTDQSLPDHETWTAFMVAWLVTAHGVDDLKRCELRDCRKYFIGGARAKWCSETCGSKVRVRNKRKRDKERQML